MKLDTPVTLRNGQTAESWEVASTTLIPHLSASSLQIRLFDGSDNRVTDPKISPMTKEQQQDYLDTTAYEGETLGELAQRAALPRLQDYLK